MRPVRRAARERRESRVGIEPDFTGLIWPRSMRSQQTFAGAAQGKYEGFPGNALNVWANHPRQHGRNVAGERDRFALDVESAVALLIFCYLLTSVQFS